MPLPGTVDQSRLPDFEVTVTFLSAEEGGRTWPARQGYRPDMGFADERHVWMIHPEFLREDGSSYSLGDPVPPSVRANMYVLNPESLVLIRDGVCVRNRL